MTHDEFWVKNSLLDDNWTLANSVLFAPCRQPIYHKTQIPLDLDEELGGEPYTSQKLWTLFLINYTSEFSKLIRSYFFYYGKKSPFANLIWKKFCLWNPCGNVWLLALTKSKWQKKSISNGKHLQIFKLTFFVISSFYIIKEIWDSTWWWGTRERETYYGLKIICNFWY